MTTYERETEILIIGAGITGLSLAKRLEEQGKDYIILEAWVEEFKRLLLKMELQ